MEEENNSRLSGKDMNDSPAANTRSKGTNQCSTPGSNQSSTTPKKQGQLQNATSGSSAKKSNLSHSQNRTDSGSQTTNRSRLTEIRAASLRKLRQEGKRASVQQQHAVYDPHATAHEAKYRVKGQTGLLIDEIMEGHFNPWDHEHVEKPERLISIRERLKELGLIDRCKQVWNMGGQQDNPLGPHTDHRVGVQCLLNSSYPALYFRSRLSMPPKRSCV